MRTFLLFVSFFFVIDIGPSKVIAIPSEDNADFPFDGESPPWETAAKWPFYKDFFPYPVESPINIITADALPTYLPPLSIHFPWQSNDGVVSIENTGYYLEVLLPHEVKERPYLTGGPLCDREYIFEQLHFHWNKTDLCGSENYLDGHCFSTEVHLVFYNKMYGSYKESVHRADGVAVLAYFGTVSPENNKYFDHLIHEFSKITEPETKTNGSFDKEFSFLNIMFDQVTYYAFPGSLTTDPYSRCVTWIVCPTPYKISSEQLNAFRMLKGKDHKNLQGNDRALQKFNGRPLITPKNEEVFKFLQEISYPSTV